MTDGVPERDFKTRAILSDYRLNRRQYLHAGMVAIDSIKEATRVE